MTHKLLLTTSLISLLLIGCAQPAPDLAGKNNISDADHIEGDTVSIDENSMAQALLEIITVAAMVSKVSILVLRIIRSPQIWKTI